LRVCSQIRTLNALLDSGAVSKLPTPFHCLLIDFLGALAYYAPKLYREYSDKLGELVDRDPSLLWNFNNSIYPTATVNFGPSTVCYDHLDFGNRAAGWCDITAAGPYDYKKGGHLILFDIDKIIEFPPGSHILIPSAVMRHGNTPIQPHERRMGFTQYAASALFRWVDNGFQKAEDVRGELKERLDADAPTRFEQQLGLYSKLEELSGDRIRVFGK
jgi:hypothetical protein